ncbi:unnamed protein product, partial [Ectocarpus fasciculatus]
MVGVRLVALASAGREARFVPCIFGLRLLREAEHGANVVVPFAAGIQDPTISKIYVSLGEQFCRWYPY